MAAKKKGLYANIHAKRKRIKAGSGREDEEAGSERRTNGKGFFKQSAKTAKRNNYAIR